LFYSFFPSSSVKTPSLKPRELESIQPKRSPSVKRHSK
jgi:hypothetical protein